MRLGSASTEDDLDLYGKYKAKIHLDVFDRLKDKPDGKLVLCTAITPTPAGEGKTTTNVGLAMGLCKIGKKAISTLREPSLGPCFGIKGGAAGGGYAQVIPMEDINLHFTGDIHAITTAHNLCAAVLDNHLFQGNELDIDPENISWPRVVDLNDRALRSMTVGQDGEGVERQTRFDITVASEIMAILCLATDLEDLKSPPEHIIVVPTRSRASKVTAKDIKVSGSMAVLLKDAFMPNLVQTLENTPAIVHGGPFANIAHGCNSVQATRMALKLGDYCITEAGFGADLGAEKFFDIKCRYAGLVPDCIVLVATIRALKMHGGVALTDLKKEDLGALAAGHGEPGEASREHAVVRPAGSGGHQPLPRRHRRGSGPAHRAGGSHGRERGPLRRVGRGRRRRRGPRRGSRAALRRQGQARLPLPLRCGTHHPARRSRPSPPRSTAPMESTSTTRPPKPSSASRVWATAHCPSAWPRPSPRSPTTRPRSVARSGWRLTVREVRLSAGAGMIVPVCGKMMTMPGLPKKPAAEQIDLVDGKIVGLF